jgi:hypothetical protein
MKFLSRICPEIFKSRLAQIFFIAVLCISSFASDWEKVFLYFNDIDKNHCKPVFAGISSGNISFSACYYNDPLTSDEVLSGFFTLISFPSIAGTDFFISDLKKNFPMWCYETFECLEVFVFIIFNSIFWLIAGYYIEFFYGKYHRHNLPEEKVLKIFNS